MNPGERGMQMKVRFRDGAPVLADDRDRKQEISSTYAA
jgi:hypothetical protein